LHPKLSICLIIKNEEKYLSRCLSSVENVADEIIVVDTGSTDNSVAIARKFTHHIYNYKWENDFSAARNYGLDKASGDWILILDGDEELGPNCAEALHNTINNNDAEAYLLRIINYTENASALPLSPDLVIRLFRNDPAHRYKGMINEQISDSIIAAKPDARIDIAEDVYIIHYGYLKGTMENQNKLKRRIDWLTKAVTNDPENLLDRFQLAMGYYMSGDLKSALAHFLFIYNKVNLEKLYAPRLMRKIVLCLYYQGKPKEALQFIDNELSRTFPDMGDLYYLKGIICKDLGYYAQSYESFRELLTLPSQPPHYSSIYCQHKYKIYYLLGGLAEYFMDKEQALSYYLESLKQNPRALNSFKRMIAILNPRTNPEYTINSLNKVFDLSHAGLQADMASIFYKEGAYKLALDCIKQLEDYGQISENIKLLKGLCLLRNKQYSEAEEELQLINNNKPLYIMARQYLLLYYWLVQDYRKASGCLRRIKNAGADPATIYILNLLTRGTSSHTNEISTVQDRLYTLVKEIMDLLVEIGDSHRVNEAFQNVAPLLGKRPSHLLAELYYNHEKYELAQEEFRSLLETDNIDARTFYYLGKTCWAQGDLNSTERYFRKAIDKNLDTPKTRWEMARLYQELSVQTLREGLKHCPDSEELTRVLQELEDNLLEI